MADLVPEIEEIPNQIEKAKKFLRNGCGCSRGTKGVQCSRDFNKETVLFNTGNSGCESRFNTPDDFLQAPKSHEMILIGLRIIRWIGL